MLIDRERSACGFDQNVLHGLPIIYHATAKVLYMYDGYIVPYYSFINSNIFLLSEAYILNIAGI